MEPHPEGLGVSSVSSHIRMSLYLYEPVFSENQTSALESLISDFLPTWGRTYRLSEDDPKYGAVKKNPDQGLFDALNEHFPIQWGQGSAVLSGDRDDVVIFLDTTKSTLPPELNSIGIEIVGANNVNDKPVHSWAEEFFLEAVARLSTRYGCAYAIDEFEAKNLVRTEGGVSAVGVRIGAAIPGVYWLNFFGDAYLEMAGLDRFLSLPAGVVLRNPKGVIVRLADTPHEWQDREYVDAARQIVEHLGIQFFFDRDQPERATKAPSFKKR